MGGFGGAERGEDRGEADLCDEADIDEGVADAVLPFAAFFELHDAVVDAGVWVFALAVVWGD